MPQSLLAHIKRQLSRRGLRQPEQRNFALGVVNGAVFRVTMVLIDSEVVLAWFLSQLGVSNFLIGSIPSIRMGSSFLLQIAVSGHLQQRRYKLPFYRTLSVIRFVALMGLAAAVAWIATESPWLVIVFFVLLTAYSMVAGLSGLSFMDMVGKVIAPRRRGTFFGQRSFFGGILALGASAFVGFILAEPDGFYFPLNISLLFVLAAITLALALSLMMVELRDE